MGWFRPSIQLVYLDDVLSRLFTLSQSFKVKCWCTKSVDCQKLTSNNQENPHPRFNNNMSDVVWVETNTELLYGRWLYLTVLIFRFYTLITKWVFIITMVCIHGYICNLGSTRLYTFNHGYTWFYIWNHGYTWL